jgi:hypothetical protein
MVVFSIPIGYLILRLIRRFLPKQIVRYLLQHSWIIKPGLETQAPRQAVEKYKQILEGHGISFEDKRVLIFGYGGSFAVAVHVLERGASHVVLSDKFAVPDEKRNRALMEQFGRYLLVQDGQVLPDPTHITLVAGDILDLEDIEPMDIVLSNSVYEHLPANLVKPITQKLASFTKSDGVHLHNIDLRDHYFKYPFEMLAYSQEIWERWLNPTSNLNRLRYTDYRVVFESCFKNTEITVVERDEDKFESSFPRIRPEFLTGDRAIDAVTVLRVFAVYPSGESQKTVTET